MSSYMKYMLENYQSLLYIFQCVTQLGLEARHTKSLGLSWKSATGIVSSTFEGLLSSQSHHTGILIDKYVVIVVSVWFETSSHPNSIIRGVVYVLTYLGIDLGYFGFSLSLSLANETQDFSVLVLLTRLRLLQSHSRVSV